MSGLLAEIAAQVRALSGLEAVAVATAAAYLVLAIRQNIWCWVSAAVSTGIYVYIFLDARLYMESVLNVFYFAMAIYGWHSWRSGGRSIDDLPVVSWPPGRHLVAILVAISLSAASGYLLSAHTDADFPYIDSMTTWGAFWATFLVARKVLENWWYWLVIDVVSAVVFWVKGLELTSLLFVVYVLLIPVGYVAWRRSMQAA